MSPDSSFLSLTRSWTTSEMLTRRSEGWDGWLFGVSPPRAAVDTLADVSSHGNEVVGSARGILWRLCAEEEDALLLGE